MGRAESQEECQRRSLRQILAVHGHLATSGLRLQIWHGKSPIVSFTQSPLILRSLEISSDEDLHIILFFLITYTNYDSRIVNSIG